MNTASEALPMDARILAALRAAEEGGVCGAELAVQLGVTRAAVWARIQNLRALGYGIEADPHRGYRLTSVPDVLHADDLLSRLSHPRVIGSRIEVFQETASTNDLADQRARAGVREGAVVFAEAQTRGRGRLGRSWSSVAGKGLWLSVLLRPNLPPRGATQITVAAAVALARTLRNVTGFEPAIKWPNDLQMQGRKVAGILTELVAELDRIRYAIVGIGVNVNHAAGDFPGELKRTATSLALVTGCGWLRAELASALLGELEADYQRVGAGRFAEIAEEWEAGCETLGRAVRIRVGEREIQGTAESLDAEGALLVRTGHGHLERVVGGDVVVNDA